MLGFIDKCDAFHNFKNTVEKLGRVEHILN